MRWNPAQYQRFGDQRGRPFLDLVDRIGAERPRQVVDLGCGPGNLTALLTTKWPTAKILGIDSSPEMVRTARDDHRHDRLNFVECDIADYVPDSDTDVLLSNAALQWVSGHRSKIDGWLGALAPGGWIGFQVPGNFHAPSHQLLREIAATPRWSDQLRGVLSHHDEVAEALDYAALLLGSGCTADVWETTYVHQLDGVDPVLEWMRGTGLRPVLAALDKPAADEFERTYADALRTAYPPSARGTLYPFRRIFAVGRKS